MDYDPTTTTTAQIDQAGGGQAGAPVASNGGDGLFSSIPMLLTAIGGGMSGGQAYGGGSANGSILRNNANLDRLRATQAIQAGDLAGNRIEARANQLVGAQQASFAGQGVQATGGTAGAVATSTRATAAMDDLITRTQADRQAYALTVQAESEQYAGDQAIRRADQAITGSLISVAGQEALFTDPSYRSRWQGTSSNSGFR